MDVLNCSGNDIEFRICFMALDDLDTRPDLKERLSSVEEVLADFRKHLAAAVERGQAIIAYGPIKGVQT